MTVPDGVTSPEPLLSTIRPTVLSLRLSEIVSMIPPCPRVIDVGTDHGQVPAFLLENRRTDYVIATDIHEGPAETARRYLRRQGVTGKSDVIRTDGLHGIRLAKGDTVLISGLGGMEMIRILSEAVLESDAIALTGVRFVLQPQRSQEELRVYLASAGMNIQEERIVCDREKYYVILSVTYSGNPYPSGSLAERMIGPRILSDRPPNYGAFLHHMRNVLHKQLRARPELRDVILEIDALLLAEDQNQSW